MDVRNGTTDRSSVVRVTLTNADWGVATAIAERDCVASADSLQRHLLTSFATARTTEVKEREGAESQRSGFPKQTCLTPN